MVSAKKGDLVPDNIKIAVIDHHLTNEMFGTLNLVDTNITSVGELLYLVFEDWGVSLDKNIADCLMTGIVGDTGAFSYPGSNERTFKIASELMKLGADKDRAVHQLYRSESFELVKFYGEVLIRSEIDEAGKFFWSAIPYDSYEKLGRPVMAKESSASLFAQIVEGTDFGFVAVEQEKNKLAISFRSRTGFDTSKIASELGGGGHIYASGANVEGLPFDKAIEKVLEVCRKYANKS
jgi:phosphoesterase RecJ-like protein